MIWVILTALAAVCGATKLDANQLAPISSRTAGGNLGDLIAPLSGSKGLPSGSYANDAQGVVVDAASPGTRTSGVEPTGLGGSRASYGSKDSKVGDAAFGVSGNLGLARIAPGFASFVQANERQAGPANGNALKFASGLDNFSFETDNGISVGEISADGSYNAQKDEGDSSNTAGNNNQVPSRFGGANSGGSFASSTNKPFVGQPQGPDNSYYYDKPSKPLTLPVLSSGQYSNNQNSQFVSQSSQFGSKPSTQFGQQTSTQFGQTSTSQTSDSSLSPTEQNQGVIYQYNKPTTIQLDTRQKDTAFAQATASSGKPGQVGTDSRFGTQQSSSQFGSSGSQFGQNFQSTFNSGSVSSTAKPISSSYQQTQVVSKPQTTQQSSFTSSQSTSQTSQFGKKPVSIIPFGTSGSKFSQNSQFGSSGSQFGQNSQFGLSGSQFGQNTQSTFGSGSVSSTAKPIGSTYQQTQVVSKPQTTQQSSFTSSQSTSQTSQFGKKPVSTIPFGNSGSQIGQNSQFGSSGSQFGQNSQFGSYGSQFGQNYQSTYGSGSVLSTGKPISSSYQQTQVFSKPQTTQQSSFTYTQSTGQTSQLGKKPVSTSQFGTSGSQFGQNTQFGLSGSQFGQNSQSTFGSGSVSSTVKPISSSYQQFQVVSKPQTTQQSSFTSSQSTSQTSQFGKKPVSTSQFGTSGSQFGQNSQFGLPGSQFGQNSQSTFGSGSVSSTVKPISSSYQQTQVVLKPQTTQQSSFTSSQSTSQTSQFGKKPVSIIPFGTSGSKFIQNSQFGSSGSQFGQNSQFGLSGSQFGQNTQSTFGSGSVSSTAKPIGSTYQQTQVVSKPQTTQQSSFTSSQSTSQTSQFGKKPVSTIPFGTSGSQIGQNSQFGSSGAQFGQNSQFGSYGSQFGQNYQSTYGSGSVLSTSKPISSSYQQTQVFSKPQTTQQSSFTYTQSTGQTSQLGKKPVSTSQFGTSGSQFGQNSQFGLSGSQFGQNSQSTFGSGSVSSTVKPISSSYQQFQVVSKPQTTQQSSFTSSETSQFGKKPVSTIPFGTSGSQFSQNSQFGSSGSQFGQNSQFGSSGSQFGQNSQLGLSGSQFGQNTQSTFGSGSVSSTAKPIGSTYQQTQIVSKPQTTQQSSFTSSQSTSQTSQFGKKPVSTTQFGSPGSQFGQNSQFGLSGSQFGQNSQLGLSGSQFGQNTQSTFGSGSVSSTAKPIGSTYQQTQIVSKPQTTQQSSFTSSQSTSQTSQLGKKPVSTSQFGTSGSQFNQNSQFGLSGSQFGQNSQSTFGSGLVSSTAKPIGSTYQQTQIVSKPQTTQQSSLTSSQSTSQTSQFGKKPVSTTQFGSSGSQFGQNSQFGSYGSQFGQSYQSTYGSGSVLSTGKPIGSTYQQTQVFSKPQTTQQSSFTYTQSTGQNSQLGKKPLSTSQLGPSGSRFGQNSQFGSYGSQFGQNYQSTYGSGSVLSTGKPISSSYQQTQVFSKPQTTQQSSFTYTQSTGQTSQLGKKPVSTSQFGTSGSQFGQNSQFGLSGSQFGQNSQSTFGSVSVSSTAKPIGSTYQQTQIVSKPQTTQQSSFTSSQFTSQTSQFGKKPVSTTQFGSSGSQFGQNSQFGSSGSQFGQNSQSTFGSGLVSSTAKPISSSYQQTQVVSKPQTTQQSSFTSSQSTSQTSQFGKKPVSTSQFGTSGSQFGQNSQFGLSGSQFAQNSQPTFGSGSVSSTVKPISSSYQQTQVVLKPQTTQQSSFTSSQSTSQTSQFGKKPVSTTQFGSSGSQFGQNSQFGLSGSQFGQNTQSTFGSGSVSSTAKPISSSYQQTQVVSKPQTTQQSSFTYTQSTGQTSQLGQKPVSTSQFGTSGSQFGQNSQFGSSGSQFGQNSQSTFGSGSQYSQGQTSQYGKKPVSTTTTGVISQQTQFGSSGSQFGQKPVTSTVTGVTSSTGQSSFVQKPSTSDSSFYQQSQFESTGTRFGQKPQASQGSSYSSSTGSTDQIVQTSQYGVGGSTQNLGSSFQQTQSAGSSGSQIDQTIQTTQFGIKPVGSVPSTQGSTQFGTTPTRFGESSQTIVPISTISQNVDPAVGLKPSQILFGSSLVHLGQKPQARVSQFGSSSGSNVAPFSTTQTGQVSKYETSQFGVQNKGVVSSTQKPIGSSLSQTNYQQYQYTQTADKSGSLAQFGKGSQSNVGSSQGSAFQVGQSIGGQSTHGTVQTASVTGFNKPQSVLDQKVQQSQTNFNSAVSTSQTPIGSQPLKPLGLSSTQATFLQTGSSQFGSVKPVAFSGPVIQTSNKGSIVQGQSSAVASSQFGVLPTPSTEVSSFSIKPEYSIIPSLSFDYNPSVFSSTPSRLGLNVDVTKVSSQAPAVPVPGYELVFNQGSSTFSGVGEQFGGPRDPPRFDDKTGYYY